MLLAVVLFALGIYLGARWPRFFSSPSPTRTYNTPVLLKQVQALSELVTVKYVMEKVEVWDDPPAPVLSLFNAGDNRILLLAHGIVNAGVDLSRLKPDDLQLDGKRIVIKLPFAQITDAYLDDNETKVIERSTGFLRSFDKDLEQNVRHNAVDDIRRAARTGGILKDADDRARAQLANLFFQLGFEQVTFRSPWGGDSSTTRPNTARVETNFIDLIPRETAGTTNR